MSQPRHRIIVDGVEFGDVFRFHRIFSSVMASMQPPRLVVGLLMVSALMTFGRLWDSFTPPRVPPGGLGAAWTADDQAEAQAFLAATMEQHVPVSRWPQKEPNAWGKLDAAEVLGLVELTYRSWREDSQGLATFETEETAYFDVLERIDAVREKGAFEAAAIGTTRAFREVVRGTLAVRPGRVTAGLRDLLIGLPHQLWLHERLFVLCYGILFLLVVAVGGGALCRMAACQAALHERIRVFDAVQFGMSNWVRLSAALIFPLLLAAVAAAIPTALGLLMTLPYLDVVGALLYGVALGVGFLMSFLLVGYVIGLSLFLPAIACERCDPFDAAQRVFAYTLQRPLHLFGYALIGILGLVLGFAAVSLFITLTLNLTAFLFGLLNSHSATSIAGGAELFDMTGIDSIDLHGSANEQAAGWLISFWQTAIRSILAAYVIAYITSASTEIYLLMRRACDGQDLEEIWRPGLIAGTLAPLPHRTTVVEDGEAE